MKSVLSYFFNCTQLKKISIYKIRRHGVAIPVVLSIVIALASIGVFIYRMMVQQNRQNITNYHQLQAHFIARAGMEHALLKIRFLQRELYDAVCLFQGRNPLFDFSRPIDENLNPGPIYLYRRGEAQPAPEGFVTPDFQTLFSNRRNPPSSWLQTFISDLNSGEFLSLGIGNKQKVNGVMRIDAFPTSKEFLLAPLTEASYKVTSIDVVAQDTAEDDKGKRVTNQMVVEITVESSLVTETNEKWKQSLKRVIRISRDPKF